jgi:hypothetical protein
MPRPTPARGAFVATSVSVAAPIGGWNARDALAEMPPLDATDLINWFPRPDRVQTRRGFASYATGIPGTVETLAEWRGPTSAKMIAAGGGGIYDVSSTGAVGAALASGFANTRFQQATITTGGGTFVVLANGADAVRNYNGAVISTPAITGVTSANLIHVNLYRLRLFFTEVNSLRVWVLPVNSIAGAATLLDFGPLCKRGGYMMAMGTWTQDSGEGGTDDMAVFLTSEGEVLVYSGADPTSASSWSIAGIFQVAKPIGRRCMLRYGSDLCLILQDGFYSMSQLMTSNVSKPQLALSDKIRNAFADASLVGQTLYGWEAIYYPNGQRLIVNVPQQNGTFDQYVMNSISSAWCRFQNMNATTWAIYSGLPYFGGASGVVYLFDQNDQDAGAGIAVTGAQAYSDLGVAGQTKYITMFRPKLSTTAATIGLNTVIDADFQNQPIGSGATTAGGGAAWDTSPWDTTAWVSGDHMVLDWHTYGSTGQMLRARIVSNTKSQLSWYDTTYVLEKGGVL